MIGIWDWVVIFADFSSRGFMLKSIADWLMGFVGGKGCVVCSKGYLAKPHLHLLTPNQPNAGRLRACCVHWYVCRLCVC